MSFVVLCKTKVAFGLTYFEPVSYFKLKVTKYNFKAKVEVVWILNKKFT
jgi:hypothetical protein